MVRRSVLRSCFTKQLDQLEKLLSSESPEWIDTQARFTALSERYEQLKVADEKEMDLLVDADEDVLIAELEKCGEYELNYLRIKERFQMLAPHNDKYDNDRISEHGSERSVYSRSNVLTPHLRYPKLELKKFGGEVKDWLSFWNQFDKIHKDEHLTDREKFEYLLQCLKPDSPAQKLIANFPPTEDSYAKAIDLLKSRFGRDEFLIEYYVRELMSLVLNKNSSHRSLSDLHDSLEAHLRALESLGVTSSKYAAMLLLPLVESALPESVFKIWDRHRVAKQKSAREPAECLTELLAFLRVEVEGDERLKLREGSFTNKNREASEQKMTTGSRRLNSNPSPVLVSSDKGSVRDQCIFCEKLTHTSQDCAIAADASLESRNETIKKRGACFRCLLRGHVSTSCKVFVKCPVCKGRHYALMCPSIHMKNSTPNKTDPDVTAVSGLMSEFSTTYLQTLMAHVVDSKGKQHQIRIMCDSGSQRSYILKSCARNWNLKPIGEMNVCQELFGGRKTQLKTHEAYLISLCGMNNTENLRIKVLDSERICECAPRLSDPKLFTTLRNKGIHLTDFMSAQNDTSTEIQVLLGADAWAQLITPEFITLSDQLVAVKTKLGWTLVGSAPESRNIAMTTLVSLTSTCKLPDLWELETLGIKDPGEQITKMEKDQLVIDFFNKTVKRDHLGRYIVNLPWIEGRPELETNYGSAVNRLHLTTRKLRKLGKFDDYDAAIRDWIKLGIVEKVEEPDKRENRCHYLPHRAVFKEFGTTKTRPVFDASNKDQNKNSLNTCLATGPNLIDLLPLVLTGFRLHRIGIVADIEKAFLQIVVDKKDRDMLRFLWWEGKEMITLRHQRVVFGVCCSPFLLAACLRHLLDHPPDHLTEVANRLKTSFYVDNCLSGVSEKNEVESFIHSAQELLQSGGFNLREWVHRFNSDEDKIENVLGLRWYCNYDELGCSIQCQPVVRINRRTVLSFVQKVFDPLGMVAPAMLLPKMILQQSWKIKLNWDEPLPADLMDEFNAWMMQLSALGDCKIPRHINMNKTSTLHVFVDASQHGMGACIFLRTEDKNGVQLSLILAKSRVTPLKQLTLPRLELMAAVIGARLYLLAKRCLNNAEIRTFFWSDSAVVLAWLSGEGPWAVFVENRVREITSLADAGTWRHVPGKMNPADLLSRGCQPEQLKKDQWWRGPDWLKEQEDSWPRSIAVPEIEEMNKERRRTVVTAKSLIVDTVLSKITNRFSVYTKMVRTVAWILRLRPDYFRTYPNKIITSQEFAEAEKTLFLWVQHNVFGSDGKKTQDLKNLNAFYDDDGLLRMKSRILEEEGMEEYSFPIILPARHPIIERMIAQLHVTNRHAGASTLLLLLREKVWVLQGRRTVKKVVNRCMQCQRHRVKAVETPIPPLPKDRTQIVNAFQVTGTDLAGPFVLKGGEKSWIVIYTCAVYRAVHLELITSLSSMAFMQSLRRFISRRGRMDVVYSDNGTNFVGLNKAMKQLDWEEIEKFSGLMKIKWKFNPPTASWWGGFWERLIRVLKDLLKKNLKNASLDYEEFLTLLCECEFLMNNRPLTYISEDGNELQPLRPLMFLQGMQKNETVDLDQIQSLSLEKRWRYLQTLRGHLRTRFKKEYLGFLRTNVQPRKGSLMVGDIVLIGQDGVRRSDWVLGRVLELVEGKDGEARLVKLRTSAGTRFRPVQRLYPLEMDHSEDSSPVGDLPSTANNTEEEVVDQRPPIITQSGRVVKRNPRFDV